MIDDNRIQLPDGISEKVAAERLIVDGYNELPSSAKRGVLTIAFEVMREPMFLLLVVCCIIYFILGDIQEALVLAAFVCVVVGITLYQENKTERALDALRDLSSPRAVVIRDGTRKRIPGREIVRGDLLILSEGERVAADALILSCTNLLVDESLLTGESVPVNKTEADGEMELCRPGGDHLPFVYAGTLLVRGRGIARVLNTGIRTEIGKIGKSLQSVETERTKLQQETDRLVGVLAITGIILCTVTVVLYGLTRGNWIDGILAGITLAMAMLPEEFPMVVTIFLALGAWRISRKQVLTRKMPAIERLGAATVLCVDKTGTLTLNTMTLKKVCAGDSFHDIDRECVEILPETFHEVVEYGILASQKEPVDPMEKAIQQSGNRLLFDTEHLHEDWELIREYPIQRDLLALSNVMKLSDQDAFVIAAKGAPEAIADLCHLEASRTQHLSEQVHALAEDGLRVLGVARATFSQSQLPMKQHDFRFEFLGLLGFADPIRPDVPDALQDCYSGGIRVVMITGDYPDTARAIARKIGLSPCDECITGADMDEMDDVELRRRIRTVNIFARVVPEQKLRLVNALKTNGEVVAMTGDGINDAPALKAAHIGIAMGKRGTDVAREAADLVLTDDDFSSIVQAIRIGRRIYDNLKKAMAYIFAIHVPIAGISLIPIIFQLPLVLFPMHIALLELIIDPACSIVFEAEPEEADIMLRSPRDPAAAFLGWNTIFLSILQGVVVLGIVLAAYVISLSHGHGENEARALTFSSLVIANLGLIMINRSWSNSVFVTIRKPNPAFWWVITGSLTFLMMILYVPWLRQLFKFDLLHGHDLLICILLGGLSILWFELMKLIRKYQKLPPI